MTKGISDFKDFGINLNAQPVNGMTHLTFSITYKAFSFNFTGLGCKNVGKKNWQ